MQIVKRGEAPEEKVIDATCVRCRTEVRFRVGEAKYVNDQRDGDFYQVKCPVCTSLITKYVHTPKSPNWYEDH